MHGGYMKQEAEMVEANGGGASAPTPVEGTVTVRIGKAKLHCPLCTLPLKPPIFQCDAGHLACSGCDGLLSGNQCYVCGSSGSYGRIPALEAFLRSVSIPCPERGRGCRFVGSPPMLLEHIAAEHSASSPVVVRYGREQSLALTAARRWHALVGEEDQDRSLFIVSLAAHCSVREACS